MNLDTLKEQIVGGPDWLMHQFDPIADRALMLRIDALVYRSSLFLDERMSADNPPQEITPLRPLVDALGSMDPRPCHAIFHVSHCGSTLLSRLLQETIPVLAPREPLALKALAAFRRDLASPLAVLDPEYYPALRSAIWAMLERRYPDNQAVLVKGTSDTTNLAQGLLKRHANNRLILMGMRLEPFLATMLRSDLRRQETLQMAGSRLADLHDLLGDESIRLYDLDPGPMAAMNWLANMAHFGRLQRLDGERCLWLDFEQVLLSLAESLTAVIAHLGLSADAGAVQMAIEGPILKGYSKDPNMRYGADSRQAELDRCRQMHGREIAAGLAWARRVLARHDQLSQLSDWLESD